MIQNMIVLIDELQCGVESVKVRLNNIPGACEQTILQQQQQQ